MHFEILKRKKRNKKKKNKIKRRKKRTCVYMRVRVCVRDFQKKNQQKKSFLR